MTIPPFGSVRVRTTLAASVLTAGVLALGSLVIVQLVEGDLLRAAHRAFDHALEESHSENEGHHLGAHGRGERQVLPVATAGGPLLLAYREPADPDGRVYTGTLVDRQLARPVARIVIDRRSLEVLELTDLTGQPVPGSMIPIDLPAAFANGELDRDHSHRLLSDETRREVQESVDAVIQALFLIVPGLVLALGTATWFTVGRALRPVHAISERVTAISATTLDERVPVPRARDEISELAHLMNQMLDRLQMGSERQRQFIADASHELRSPLSTIVAAAEVARVSPDPNKLRRLAEDVAAEAERMNVLIADLLDLARFDELRTDRVSPAPLEELVDLEATCRQAIERLPPTGTTIALHASGPLPVCGVASQLERAIFNLLINAVRHARQLVRVEIRRHGEHARVIVDDDGRGVDPDDRDRIFERFVRLDWARVRHAGGSGIGLSLVRAIATRHGGAVFVTEAPELLGARFVLDLSLAGARGSARQNELDGEGLDFSLHVAPHDSIQRVVVEVQGVPRPPKETSS